MFFPPMSGRETEIDPIIRILVHGSPADTRRGLEAGRIDPVSDSSEIRSAEKRAPWAGHGRAEQGSVKP